MLTILAAALLLQQDKINTGLFISRKSWDFKKTRQKNTGNVLVTKR
jgi:hypothetical protein